MYKQYKDPNGLLNQHHIIRVADGVCIPFDLANADYQQFKKDIMAGGELQDADGVVMSADAAKEFVAGLL